MSFRYTLYKLPQAEELLHVPLPAELRPRYNIAPGQQVPVLANEATTRLTWAVWDDATSMRSMSSTASEPWLLRLTTQRCLVPATGFYEGVEQGVPTLARHSTAEAFCFAGLWWRTGDEVRFTLLAGDALPLTMQRELFPRWVSRTSIPLDVLHAMPQPIEMRAFKKVSVTPKLVDPAYDAPDCIRSL